MKTLNIKTIAIILGIACTSTSFAQGTQTGGGQVVDRHGYRELRDLLQHSACDWHSGEEVLKANPQVLTILSAVEKIDWYFASVIKMEIKNLDWCFTGTLTRVNAEDRDSIMTPFTDKTTQVAIRMLESTEVYIDEDTFNSISDNSKAFLILHETLHSFLGVNEPLRNENLRSTVKALKRITSNEIRTRKSFYLSLEKNNIQYPIATQLLDPIKNYILYVLGTDEERAEILKNNSIESLTPTAAAIQRALPGLTQSDTIVIRYANESQVIEDVCGSKDQALLDQILPGLSAKSLVACMNMLDTSPESRAKIATTTGFKKWLNSHFIEMSKKSIFKQAGLLSIASAAATISMNDPKNTSLELTALKGTNIYEWNKINPQGRTFYLYIKTLLEKDDLASLNAIIADPFYQAFSFTGIQTQVEAITTEIPREKALAQAIVKDLPQQFWSTFILALSQEVGATKASTFKSKLDQTRLGIKL